MMEGRKRLSQEISWEKVVEGLERMTFKSIMRTTVCVLDPVGSE
jgi:hypothetical protein